MSEELNNELAEMPILQVGDTVTGTISKVEDKQVLVDVGYKMEGVIPMKEISNFHIEEPADVLQVGDTVQLKVIKMEEDDLVLSKRAIDSETAWEKLENYYESGESFDVVVKDLVKGGVIADVGVRGFIPASQLTDHYIEDYSDFVGNTLKVKIIELNREGNRIVLSHRSVMADEKKEQKKSSIKNLHVGDVVEGTVERLANFGAFVNLGECDGLLHISQISHQRVATPEEVLSVGQQVKVQIINVDVENEKISLSMKSIEPSPWETAAEKIAVGSIIQGTVKKIATYGVFVEVLPSVEGLVHISQLSEKHVKNAYEVVSEGEVVSVKVLSLDTAARKLALSIKETVEPEVQEDFMSYVKNDDNFGIQLGDLFGDKLKNFQK